jgi:hypothetical protein
MPNPTRSVPETLADQVGFYRFTVAQYRKMS